MTSSMGQGMDELNALLAERSRYEQWLQQLTARREHTPAHVFERVRSDYAARLSVVMEQLGGRAEGLEASARSLRERVSSLAADEGLRRDARAEVELRALVGEYSAEQADAELGACDADIARIAGERSDATAELSRIEEILVLVRQPEQKAAAPAPVPAYRPLGAPPAGPESAAAFEELAFLNSVVQTPEPAPPPPAPRAPDPVPLVTSLGPSRSTGPQQAVKDMPPPRVPSGTPAVTPAFLKDMPTEQVKTLKCQECGTMNYPTEWYCERCGGELAAM